MQNGDNVHQPVWLKPKEATGKKAVAYYRHSAQDRQENSVEIQQDQVRKFAKDNGIEIIREFADKGISGLSVDGRDGFNTMFSEYIEGDKHDFEYVLVLDVSRWGRFQDTDMSAYYSGLCAKHGKQVVFTSIGFPKDDGLLHGLHLSIERYRASFYSKELSGKVWKGQEKITSQGFWGGGMPPYGMKRLLLDEKRNPVQILEHSEHKAIHNQRVTLTPGGKHEVETVRRIFNLFVNDGVAPEQIAEELNRDRVQSPGGSAWSRSSVYGILRNEIYMGTNVWNKTSQKLKSKSHHNPADEWIRVPDAFEPLVPPEIFVLAQNIIRAKEEERLRKYSDEYMLTKLKEVIGRYGMVNSRIISAQNEMASLATYRDHFSSMDMAYQKLFGEVVDGKRYEIVEMLKKGELEIADYNGILVVENLFTLHIEPAVAIPSGYETYWTFNPHLRGDIDLVMGVPLASPKEFDVLGYLFFPRFMFNRRVRIRSTMDYELSLYAHQPMELIKNLRR